MVRLAHLRAFTPVELSKTVRQGFTLIELLVVVAIIVVLLALSSRQKAWRLALLAPALERVGSAIIGQSRATSDESRSDRHAEA